MRSREHVARRGLFMLGSFTFGWVLGTVFHELGHAVAMWVTGGVVEKITINALSWSYTYYDGPPKYPIFTSWSGLLIGSLQGVILLLIIRNSTSPYLVPFFFASVSPMLSGGAYYIIDVFFWQVGDGASLIRSGVPVAVVLASGLLVLVLGLFLLLRQLSVVGLTVQDTYGDRFAILGLGILPYVGLYLTYAVLYVPRDVQGIAFAFVLAMVSVAVVAHFSRSGLVRDLVVRIAWRHVVYADLLGAAAIVIPFLIFGR